MADESGTMPHKDPPVDQKSATANGVDNPQSQLNSQDTEEDQPEIKITQTDRLNRQLLDSFLQRLNQANSGVPVVERIDCTDPEVDLDFEYTNSTSSDNTNGTAPDN